MLEQFYTTESHSCKRKTHLNSYNIVRFFHTKSGLLSKFYGSRVDHQKTICCQFYTLREGFATSYPFTLQVTRNNNFSSCGLRDKSLSAKTLNFSAGVSVGVKGKDKKKGKKDFLVITQNCYTSRTHHMGVQDHLLTSNWV